MNQLIINGVAFLVAIGLLITVHEFGHFWVARRLGVKVIRFSIGFGPVLMRWHRRHDETEYVLSALPFGGYVKMLGEQDDDSDEPIDPADIPRAFNHQLLWKRIAIVAAGPVANFLFAFIAYWLVLMAGEVGLRPAVGAVTPDSPAASAGFVAGDVIVQIGDSATPTWSEVWVRLIDAALDGDDVPIQVRTAAGETSTRWLTGAVLAPLDPGENVLAAIGLRSVAAVLPPVLGEVTPAQPASQAGLQPGDRIAAIDGQPVATWEALVATIRAHPATVLQLDIVRGAETRHVAVTPAAVDADGQRIGRIGATPALPTAAEIEAQQVLVRLNPVAAAVGAVERMTDMSLLTLRIIGRMVTGQASLTSLSGPIGIADTAGKTASAGPNAFINFLALLSVSLAVLNLLPVPALDGGHLLYFTYEGLARRPLPVAWQQQGQRLGLALLLGLMTLALYMDIMRYS